MRDLYIISMVDSSTIEPSLDNISVIYEFSDVFSDEIPNMPPLREVDFSFGFMSSIAPISKALYHMATTELKELKSQLQELSDEYIRPSTSP